MTSFYRVAYITVKTKLGTSCQKIKVGIICQISIIGVINIVFDVSCLMFFSQLPQIDSALTKKLTDQFDHFSLLCLCAS